MQKGKADQLERLGVTADRALEEVAYLAYSRITDSHAVDAGQRDFIIVYYFGSSRGQGVSFTLRIERPR